MRLSRKGRIGNGATGYSESLSVSAMKRGGTERNWYKALWSSLISRLTRLSKKGASGRKSGFR